MGGEVSDVSKERPLVSQALTHEFSRTPGHADGAFGILIRIVDGELGVAAVQGRRHDPLLGVVLREFLSDALGIAI